MATTDAQLFTFRIIYGSSSYHNALPLSQPFCFSYKYRGIIYCSSYLHEEEGELYTYSRSSLAGQPYFSYVHACAYDKWAGGSARKNTSGHSRQVFVPRKYVRNFLAGN